MSGLSKNDLDYLVRTIMPELYERKRKKDEFWEHLKNTLPEKATNTVTDSVITINTGSAAVKETRMTA